MNETELAQNADFLSIALEEIESGNIDSAEEFIEDVRDSLDDGGRMPDVQRLDEALNALENSNFDEATESAGQVKERLISSYES